MRVVSILATFSLVAGLAACGGGGGPSDLSLPSTPPTTVAAVTTPATLPAYASTVAQAKVSLLAIYNSPGAKRPARKLANPWRPIGKDAKAKIPQVFPVEKQQSDGWVQLRLPVTPKVTGWVRAADVKITHVVYRIRIELGKKLITVFKRGRQFYKGPIAVARSARSTRPGPYFLRRSVEAPESSTADGPYAYDLIAQLSDVLPLGTPIDIFA